ncbi:MAG: hypothetical protein DRH24_15665 [Deltaproteobacteria bacterium]|nr:MAG: hypothetical protein DRH24_15665 [Deltaproteobacteria bacterium]
MSKAKLQYLASKASDSHIDENIPLNTSIAKLAKEEKLNPDELARVCELANLKTFDSAVKKAASNSAQFDLADTTQIRKQLGMKDDAKTKTAAKAISTMEYSISPDFLSVFTKESLEKQASVIDTSAIEARLAASDEPFLKAKQANALIKTRLAAKAMLKSQAAEKIALQLKIADCHNEAVKQIKIAALRKQSNPFTQWPLINKAHPELKEATDSVFTKAAKALTEQWAINIEDVLATAKKEAAEHFTKEYDTVGQDGTSIVKKLDTISSYQKLYDEVQKSHLKLKGSLELHPSIMDEHKVKEVVNNTSKIDID